MARKITSLTGPFDSIDHYDENGKCVGHTTSPAEGVYYHYDANWKNIGSSSEGLWGSYNNYNENYNKVGSSSEIVPGVLKHYDNDWNEVGKTYDMFLTKDSYLDESLDEYFSEDKNIDF